MPKVKKLKKYKKKIRKKKEIKTVPEKFTKPNYYKSKSYKPNEIKIKKILKQPTEKKVYTIKDLAGFNKAGSSVFGFRIYSALPKRDCSKFLYASSKSLSPSYKRIVSLAFLQHLALGISRVVYVGFSAP